VNNENSIGRKIIMKNSHRLGTVCALALLTMIGSANAVTIASDATSITSAGHSFTQTFSVSPSSFPDAVLALNVPGDAVQSRPDQTTSFSMNATLPVASRHADSHLDIWLLLIAAIVAGGLSEIFHRRSINR
jgi:hypothetical protein